MTFVLGVSTTEVPHVDKKQNDDSPFCSASLTPGTRSIPSFCDIWPEKCQQQDGYLPFQLSAKTLKAEVVPAGKRLMSAL